MTRIRKILLGLLAAFTIAAFSGCASTHSENGVTFEKSSTLNPMSWF